ncbi:sphingosine hydroxylase [Auriculariales sp. MPI-PUGE-AT-0066]|nr:sphingosine hydroxylase [Auriculariales sp. MPI-PUGE-AT-0066]
MNNSTTPLLFDVEELLPRPIATPFYYTTHESVVPGLSDVWLSLLTPVIAYWLYSLLFHFVDTYDLYPQGRIHESAEVVKRNRPSQGVVIRAVILEHVIQTAVGYAFMSREEQEVRPSPAEGMQAITGSVARAMLFALGESRAMPLLKAYGPQIVQWTYWWGIPISQFIFGMFVMDTWQYMLHRAMHTNKFLYRHLHAVHHSIYVPYAFGALYNHPLEAFLLDTCGGVLSQLAAGMTTRQATLFYAISSMKTVDDHCGYNIPFDPFQMFFYNTADYHDIHHQHAGIKYNFSQPFFIHWDTLLGTAMTREQFEGRKKALPEKEL